MIFEFQDIANDIIILKNKRFWQIQSEKRNKIQS